MENNLALNIPDINVPHILRIEDLSVYNPLDVYENLTVQVLAPGFSTPSLFNSTTSPKVEEGFALNLTACHLGLQTTGCGEKFNTLNDGIYAIKYSVNPNDVYYVEYNHLRVTNIKASIQENLCALKLAACLPAPEVQAKFDLLMRVLSYIEAAKAACNFCHDATKAMVLYNYAKKILDKYECKTC